MQAITRKRHLTSWFKPEQSNESAPLWPAERVVFLNDVYFCAQDVIRLLRHRADIACGMDFDRLKLQDTPWAVRLCAICEHTLGLLSLIVCRSSLARSCCCALTQWPAHS